MSRSAAKVSTHHEDGRMDVVTGWRDVPAQAKGAVLAVGNFDGVHRGHQAVLGRARDLAKETGKRSGAVVFEPHPREFFAPDQPFFRLTPLPVKLELLAALGLDETFVIEFERRQQLELHWQRSQAEEGLVR